MLQALALSIATLSPLLQGALPTLTQTPLRAAAISVTDSSALVEALNSSNTLHLQFGRAGVVHAQVDVLRPTSTGGLVWSGRLLGVHEGSVSFAVGSSSQAVPVVQGVLRRGHELFVLHPSPTGEPIVQAVDQASLPNCGNGPEHVIGRRPDGSRDESTTTFLAASVAGVRPIVDVLVLYTPAARAGEGGVLAIEALIELAAAEANLAYMLSGLEHRVRVVHTQEIPYVESGNHFGDLLTLQNLGDGAMDAAGSLRDAFAADCVMLITDTLNTCGNGFLWFDPPNPAFAAYAFSVVSRHCAVSNLSFAHELGHNMGCDHDHANSTGGAYSYSYGYNTLSGAWRTVMAYPPGTRIPRFSDPNAMEGGEVLGIASGLPGQAHNAQSLLQVVPLLATFRTAIPHPLGTGMVTSAGQTFTLGYSGSNGLAQNDFKLQASGGVPAGVAIAFFGHEPNNAAFFGGSLLAQLPLQRLPVKVLDGSGAAEWTIFPGASFVSGQETFFQVYGFDATNPAGQGVAMSNGLRVEFVQ